MPKVIEQFEEICDRLRISWNSARQIIQLALDRKANDETPIQPFEELALAIGSWAITHLRTPPDAVALLLKQMEPLLREIAPEMLRVWTENDNTVPVPAHELHLAEHRYAVWGDNNQFWDVQGAFYENPLPHPPVWRTSLHLTGLYFAYLRIKERKDADQAEHAPESPRR